MKAIQAILFIFAATIANAARAEFILPPAETAAVALVRSSDATATGVLIINDERGAYVLTNNHAVRDANGFLLSTDVSVGFSLRGYTAGKVIDTDPRGDLALIKLLKRPEDLKPIPICRPTEAINAGDAVVVAGFAGGQLRAYQTAAMGYGPKSPGAQRNTLFVPAHTRDGDSGSPIISSDGKLAGIVWGILTYQRDEFGRILATPERRTAATAPDQIAAFVDRNVGQARLAQAVPSVQLQAAKAPAAAVTRAGDLNDGWKPRGTITTRYSGPGAVDQVAGIVTDQQAARCAATAPTASIDVAAIRQQIAELKIQIARLESSQPESVEIDEDQIVEVIAGLIPSKEEIAEAIVAQYGDQLRGPAGEPGPAGQNGNDGRDAPPVTADEIAAQLPTVEQIAQAVFAEYGEQLRGPAGPVGEPAPINLEFLDGVGGIYDVQTASPTNNWTLKIPAIHVQNFDRDSNLVDEQKYPLPTPIKLRHGKIDEGN